MISANQRKFITSLHLKKYRQKYRNFLVEGEKMVDELLKSIASGPPNDSARAFGLVQLFGTERWASENAALLDPFYDKFKAVASDDLKKVGTLTTPNEVLAVVAFPPESPLAVNPQRLSLFLDGLQDPGNLGAILRIADWFGLNAVYCSPDTVDAFSPKVIQSGMGACFRVRIWEDCSIAALLEKAPDMPVLGAVMEGDSLFGGGFPDRGLLVIGNEGKGIRTDTLSRLTHRVTIPKGALGGAESLNAAVATGILTAVLIHQNND